MTSNFRSVAVCAAAAWLVACGGGGSTPPAGPTGTKGWTILVYMTADNNLEGAGLGDLLEMASVGSGENLRFVVQADRAVGEYTGGVLNLPDWTSTKRLLVHQGSLEVLADLGELDMGSTASLADFVNWGVRTYPGEHTMLVFWDHGGGWKGFGWDDSNVVAGEPSHLSLDRIVAGVTQGLGGTGLTKLDVIGFDACLMATVEVATSLQPLASYLIASEEVEPGHGWDWAAFGGGGALGAVDLSKKVIDGYWAQASSAAFHDAADVTLSLVDLSKIPAVQTAIANLAGTYGTAGAVAPIMGQVVSGRRGVTEYAANPDPAQAYNLVDVAGLFGGMSGVSGAAAVQAAVTSAVLYQRFGAAKAGSNGLSIYFPPDGSSYAASATAYGALPGMGPWRTFLAAVYGGGTAQPTPAFTGGGTYSALASGLTLSAVLATDPADVSSAFIAYGLSNGPSEVFLLGDTPVIPAGADVTGTWDWTVLHVSQGSSWDYGYLSLEIVSTAPPGLLAANIPFHYVAASGAAPDFALWRIVFDGNGNLVADNTYLYSGGGVAELAPAAGSRLHTLVKHMADVATWTSEWVRAADGTAQGAGFDATQPLGLDLVALPSGWAFAAILRAENAGGEGTWTYVTNVAIP